MRARPRARSVAGPFDQGEIGIGLLTIEDDGKGFPFSGRYNGDQLEDADRRPMIIIERVGLIGGELTVESIPGQGTRVEVTVPRNGDVKHEL